jgi:hypothetical protein
MVVSSFPTGKRVMGAMPDVPARRAFQFFSVPVPSAVMIPVPVMTTRRFATMVLPEDDAAAPCSRKRRGALPVL